MGQQADGTAGRWGEGSIRLDLRVYNAGMQKRVGIFRRTTSTGLPQILGWLWALPWTLVGLSIGFLLGGKAKRIDGVYEIHGPVIAWTLRHMLVPALAMTLGHVVLGCDQRSLRLTRAHERVHVRQYERWGPFFIPAYMLCWLWLSLRRRDGYRENPFEIEAYAVDGLNDQWLDQRISEGPQ